MPLTTQLHIAIDLETLSTTPDATILSIGAAAIYNDAIVDTFYSIVSVASQPNSHVSKSTLDWWSKQSATASTVLDAAKADDAPTIECVLNGLTAWIATVSRTHNNQTTFVWGNGSNFDVTILEYAYTRISSFIPWHFRNVRDMRTLYAISTLFGLNDQIKAQVQREGTHHNALDDAIYQAKIVYASLELLSGIAQRLLEDKSCQN